MPSASPRSCVLTTFGWVIFRARRISCLSVWTRASLPRTPPGSAPSARPPRPARGRGPGTPSPSAPPEDGQDLVPPGEAACPTLGPSASRTPAPAVRRRVVADGASRACVGGLRRSSARSSSSCRFSRSSPTSASKARASSPPRRRRPTGASRRGCRRGRRSLPRRAAGADAHPAAEEEADRAPRRGGRRGRRGGASARIFRNAAVSSARERETTTAPYGSPPSREERDRLARRALALDHEVERPDVSPRRSTASAAPGRAPRTPRPPPRPRSRVGRRREPRAAAARPSSPCRRRTPPAAGQAAQLARRAPRRAGSTPRRRRRGAPRPSPGRPRSRAPPRRRRASFPSRIVAAVSRQVSSGSATQRDALEVLTYPFALRASLRASTFASPSKRKTVRAPASTSAVSSANSWRVDRETPGVEDRLGAGLPGDRAHLVAGAGLRSAWYAAKIAGARERSPRIDSRATRLARPSRPAAGRRASPAAGPRRRSRSACPCRATGSARRGRFVCEASCAGPGTVVAAVGDATASESGPLSIGSRRRRERVVLAVLVLVLGGRHWEASRRRSSRALRPAATTTRACALAALLVPRGHGPGTDRDLAQLDAAVGAGLAEGVAVRRPRGKPPSAGWMLQ